MSFSLIPKEVKFFDMFEQQAENIMEAATCFVELTKNGGFDEEGIHRLRNIEHEGDNITHNIIEKLNRTFITPFDREDIHSLTHELDSITDMIFSTSKRMNLYKLNCIDKDLIEFAGVIKESVTALSAALKSLRDMKNSNRIHEHCIEVNRLENVGDHLRDQVIGNLFDNEADPITIIKWKEIFEGVETVLDICEDVANVIENILVKQA